MNRAAVFTLMKDEIYQLPRWWAYYSQHFSPRDIYIFDHDSTHPFMRDFLSHLSHIGAIILPLHQEEIFNHDWLTSTVETQLAQLLTAYDYVLFTDADELVMPAEGSLRSFIAKANDESYRCTGYETLGEYIYRTEALDKTLLTRVPLKYVHGYHSAHPSPQQPNPALLLYHLHRVNFNEAYKKNLRWQQYQWNKEAITENLSFQNRLTDFHQFSDWFYYHHTPLEPWHDRLRELWLSSGVYSAPTA